MKSNIKVLFGILYYGESEFADLIKSIISTQNEFEYSIQCISYKTKLEAHKKLYSLFSESDNEVLIKLDSDMVLKKNLKQIISDFSTSKDDHWAMDIYDCYTEKSIPALHFYRKGFNFTLESKLNCDEFNDGKPTRWMKDEGFVFHGEHNNSFQAFKTGASKGVKMRMGKTKEYSQSYARNAKVNDWLYRGVCFGLESDDDVLDANNSKLFDEFIRQSIDKYRN
jgi:hypothetical protein